MKIRLYLPSRHAPRLLDASIVTSILESFRWLFVYL